MYFVDVCMKGSDIVAVHAPDGTITMEHAIALVDEVSAPI